VEKNMTKEFVTLEVKGQGKEAKLIGTGRTPRGQRYIKDYVALEAKPSADPEFKKELADAIVKIYAE